MKLRSIAEQRPDLLTEAQLSGLVVELARLGGWTHRYHTFISKRSSYGFPDWIFARGGRLLAVELKSQQGRVRPEQQEWIDVLNSVPGVTAVVWRPADWTVIVETLTGRKEHHHGHAA